MKILVTGMTGFVGQRLSLRAVSTDEYFAICRQGSGDLLERVKVIGADLSDPRTYAAQLKAIRPDVCIHLAWQGIPDYGFETSFRNLRDSVSLLRFLVEECGCSKIIAAGSCWEYGKMFGNCQEEEKGTHSSYFVWAKQALADLGTMLSVRYGITFIWARFFYVYGPGQHSSSLIPTLVDALKNDRMPVVKTPHNANDFVYVDDVAEVLLAMAVHEIPTGIYNLGAGKSTPVWKVCEVLEEIMGLKSRYGQQLRASKVKATADFWADTTKTDRITGWRARTDIIRGAESYLKTRGME